MALASIIQANRTAKKEPERPLGVAKFARRIVDATTLESTWAFGRIGFDFLALVFLIVGLFVFLHHMDCFTHLLVRCYLPQEPQGSSS